jgi:hypothetical protein
MYGLDWNFNDSWDWSAPTYIIGAVTFALLAWKCIRLVGRQGGVRWSVGVFLGLLWIEGWGASILGTVGEVSEQGNPVQPNDLYAVALMVASFGAIVGVVLGAKLEVGRFRLFTRRHHGNSSGFPMVRGIILMSAIGIVAFLLLNLGLINALRTASESLGNFLVEYRRGITKYFLVGESWTGQGAIKDFQSSCALLLGAVLGRRLANRGPMARALIPNLVILLVAVLLTVMDATRSNVMVLLLTVIAAGSATSSRLFSRQVVILVVPIVAFFFLTALTKFSAESTDDGVDYVKGILIQNGTRLFVGNAVHDWQVGELMASGQLDWGHAGEALAQASAMLPGAPPPRLASLLREMLSRYPTGTSFWSTTEIGRRLYDGGAVAVGIGFFLSGFMVAWMSKRAGHFWMDPVRGTMALVLAMIYATSSGVIAATTGVVFTIGITHAAVRIDALKLGWRRGHHGSVRKAMCDSPKWPYPMRDMTE